MKNRKTVLIEKAFVVSLIILSIFALILSQKQAVKKTDYSHLVPARPVVADADNAYICFSNAAQMVVLTNDSIMVMQEFWQGKSFATNKIEQILADNHLVKANKRNLS